MNATVVSLNTATDFDLFWRLYPPCMRKYGNRSIAKRIWQAITSEEGLHTRNLIRDSGTYIPVHHKATPEEIIEGLRRWRSQLPESYDEQYLPAPSNWLNRGGWEG